MRLLLDTCTFLWIDAEREKVPAGVLDLFTESGNEVFLSAVSVWEIVVKNVLGRLPLAQPPNKYVPSQRRAMGIQSLSLDEETVFHLQRLPPIHRDPFDRLLICQAIVHGLALVTPDSLIRQYPVRTIWE